MINPFIQRHEKNFQNLEDIIYSIREYLGEIQRKPRFRDERNQSESMKVWLNMFIECKDGLTQSFNHIINAKEKAQSKFLMNQSSLNQLRKLIHDYPQLNFNTSEHHQNNILNQVSTRSNESNIDIYDAWKITRNSNNEIVDTYFSELKAGFDKYNKWIAHTEKVLSLKEYDYDYFQAIVRMFQSSQLANHLYASIRVNKFQNLHLSISSEDNILDYGKME